MDNTTTTLVENIVLRGIEENNTLCIANHCCAYKHPFLVHVDSFPVNYKAVQSNTTRTGLMCEIAWADIHYIPV